MVMRLGTAEELKSKGRWIIGPRIDTSQLTAPEPEWVSREPEPVPAGVIRTVLVSVLRERGESQEMIDALLGRLEPTPEPEHQEHSAADGTAEKADE